jgi:hypothetical protein
MSSPDEFPQFGFGKEPSRVNKVFSVFNSFAESDEADKQRRSGIRRSRTWPSQTSHTGLHAHRHGVENEVLA